MTCEQLAEAVMEMITPTPLAQVALARWLNGLQRG